MKVKKAKLQKKQEPPCLDLIYSRAAYKIKVKPKINDTKKKRILFSLFLILYMIDF